MSTANKETLNPFVRIVRMNQTLKSIVGHGQDQKIKYTFKWPSSPSIIEEVKPPPPPIVQEVKPSSSIEEVTPTPNIPPIVTTKSITRNCFICKNSAPLPSTNKTPEVQKEQAELLRTFVINSDALLLQNSPEEQNTQFNSDYDGICKKCDLAMSAVWELRQQMVAVLRQIDDVVKIVKDVDGEMSVGGKILLKESEDSPIPSSSSEQNSKVKEVVDVAVQTEEMKKEIIRINPVIPVVTDLTRLLTSNSAINGGEGNELLIAPPSAYKFRWSLRTENLFGGHPGKRKTKDDGEAASTPDKVPKLTESETQTLEKPVEDKHTQTQPNRAKSVAASKKKCIKVESPTQQSDLMDNNHLPVPADMKMDLEDKPIFQCGRCTKTFNLRGFYNRHMNAGACKIGPQTPNKANGKVKTPQKRPRRYKKAQVSPIQYKCPRKRCGQIFLQEEHLTEHLVACNTRICPFCEKSVARGEYTSHIRHEHYEKEEIPCTHCCRRFPTQIEMDMHILHDHSEGDQNNWPMVINDLEDYDLELLPAGPDVN